MTSKVADLINIICFIIVFIIMSQLLSLGDNLLQRIIFAVILVWSGTNTGLIVNKYLYKNK